MKSLVVFDLDGTLVDTAPNILKALSTVFEKNELGSYDRETVLSVIGLGSQAIVTAGLSDAKERLSDSFIVKLCEELEDVYSDIPAHRDMMFPNALSSIKALRNLGNRLAICTNKPQKLAELVLNDLEISAYFDAVVGGDVLPFRKPDPRHLIHTINVAGGTTSRSIYIGDAHTDMLAAIGARVTGVRFSGGYDPITEGQLDLVVRLDAFDELVSLVYDTLNTTASSN